MKKVKSISGMTMLVFGALIACMGILGLAAPQLLFEIIFYQALSRPDFPAELFIRASSQASMAMGIYYILAALTNNQAFYRWSVPVRGMNFLVFTAMVLFLSAPITWLLVASLELLGALATGFALRKERAV